MPKRSQAWGHLRMNRFGPDTYLNKPSLAQYGDVFAYCCYCLANESVQHPGLGRVFLQDPLIRPELSGWSEEELLSNDVMFEFLPIN
jgi:hypothetical protein